MSDGMAFKIQSAMEYLMTYGWAILAIAVVLGVLYSLGVFNPSNFAPKAQPGSCQVFRPNGPGTSYDVNLEGACGGEMPQYVAVFSRKIGQYVSFTSPTLMPENNFTMAAWVMVPAAGIQNSDWYTVVETNDFDFEVVSYSLNPIIRFTPAFGSDNLYTSEEMHVGAWAFITATRNISATSKLSIFMNGVHLGSGGSNTLPLSINSMRFGEAGLSGIGGADMFNGSISNVQIYDTSLSANDIEALYLEGIGGTPIDLQHLAGWWPLNGNANDYSGNNNDGVPTNVTFTGSWGSGYTPP